MKLTPLTLKNIIQLLSIIALASIFSGCSSDDGGPVSSADPLNCKSPCLAPDPAPAPALSQSSLAADTGGDITVTLIIAGGTDTIDTAGSTITFEPMPSQPGGQGRLATNTTAVTATDATTLVFNISIPGGSVTGEFYPLINISNTANLDSVEYTLDTANSSINYSFEEYLDDGNGGAAGSSYTANGTLVGTVSTPFAIPVLTLTNPI